MTSTSSPKTDAASSPAGSSACNRNASSKKKKSVLTNLQRGNTEADVPIDRILSFHEQSGQGEITIEMARSQCLIDRLDKFGFTALHYACYYGQFSSVKILVECGADVNKLAPELSSPLLLAAAGGHAEIVKFILGCGADVHHMDIMGNDALIYASAGNHPHTCNELLGYRPDVTHSNEDGETAFTIAVRNNSSLAQAVLENYLMAVLTS